MGKPLNWKWKLSLGIIGAISFVILYSFTDGAHLYVLGKLNDGYKDIPAEERRSSSAAGRWLMWAYFRGYTLGEDKNAYEMYRDFLGVPKKGWIADHIFSQDKNKEKGQGKASADWQQGWGILHPDAADAFYDYICLMDAKESGVNIARESKAFYMYLYILHAKKSPDKQPHPMFAKYWPKVRQKILNGRVGFSDIPNFDFDAKKAKPYVEIKN